MEKERTEDDILVQLYKNDKNQETRTGRRNSFIQFVKDYFPKIYKKYLDSKG